jgi:hypothetical protein
MNGLIQRLDIGWLIAGAIVVFVGGYFFLRNTLGWEIGELNWDAIWPIAIIGVGASILLGVARHARGTQ